MLKQCSITKCQIDKKNRLYFPNKSQAIRKTKKPGTSPGFLLWVLPANRIRGTLKNSIRGMQSKAQSTAIRRYCEHLQRSYAPANWIYQRDTLSAWLSYILRLYCPPTSNNAVVICPSEQTRAASMSLANTFSLLIAACCKAASAFGATSA